MTAPAKMSLYDIGENLAALDALLEESQGELTPEIEAWMREYGLAEKEKVDRYGAYAKELDATTKALKEEEERLAARRKATLNKIERLKFLADGYLVQRGITKVEGKLFTIARQKNGGKPALTLLVQPEALPDAYRVTVTTVNPDKEKLRAAVEAGEPGIETLARLEEPGYSVRFR